MSTRIDFAPPQASTWRQIALVTVLVVLVHTALLVGVPQWGASKDVPLPEQHFVTRTIELAPPTPPAPVAPEVTKQPVPKKLQEHHAAPAHRSAAPHPTPAPEELAPTPPAPVLATPDASAEQARSEVTPPAEVAPTGEPAPVNEAGAASGKGSAQSAGDDAGDIASGLPRPGHTMPVHSSVKLGFEAVGQRGVQPWRGAFGELVWQQDGDQYSARMALKIFFKTISMWTSTGRVDATGVAPDRFSETKRSQVASHFVRDEGKVVFSNNSPTVPLLPGAQDRLSVTLQLGALLADTERYPEGSRISIQTVGPKEAGIWTFVVEGNEHITTPAGEFDVRRLSRTPRDDRDYKLELWLAPSLGWLPARMRQTMQDGDVIDLLLRDVSAP